MDRPVIGDVNLQIFLRKIDIANGFRIVRPEAFVQFIMKGGFRKCRPHLYKVSFSCKAAVDSYVLSSYPGI